MAASKYKSQYKKGIGMTANKNLTLPDIIYLLMNVIQLLHSLLTSAYVLFAYGFLLFSLSLKMHLNKKFTIK